MRDLIIKLTLADEEAARFDGRMAMVVALSEEEAAILRANLNGVHAFLKIVRRGTMEPDIAGTLDMLIEPAATAEELQDRTRECLGRAIFVAAEQQKGRLQ